MDEEWINQSLGAQNKIACFLSSWPFGLQQKRNAIEHLDFFLLACWVEHAGIDGVPLGGPEVKGQ